VVSEATRAIPRVERRSFLGEGSLDAAHLAEATAKA